MTRSRKTVALATTWALLAGGGWWLFASKMAPTRIAVVNMMDFQYAAFSKADDSPWIHLTRVQPGEEGIPDLDGFDAVYMFGHAIQIDETMRNKLLAASEAGVSVFVSSETRQFHEYTNLDEEHLETVASYFHHGGPTNIRSLLNYTRREFDGSKWFVGEIQEPIEVPPDSFFHPDRETPFADLDAYEEFLTSRGAESNARKVAIVASLTNPMSPNRTYIDELVSSLESSEVTVYPMASFRKRLEWLQAIEPDLVVFFAHGRLDYSPTEAALRWLEEKQIPVLTPLTVMEPYEDWIEDQRGMSGGFMSQSITMPELDGGIDPFTFSAQYPNEDGLFVNRAIPERLERFTRRVLHWIELDETPNADKRIAIFYFKGAGQNSLVAGGLEVAPSLLNALRSLEEQGYTTGPLPETAEELFERIQSDGPILGPYADGAFEAWVESGRPELVPVADYQQWLREELDPELLAEVEEQYGAAPGDYLVTRRDQSEFLALPRVQFGNIVLIPQLMASLSDDELAATHGEKVAPPHPYIAGYLWARRGFQADAMMHWGTHGNLEFTPWKQVALSDRDWPDALVGDLPHGYLYEITNIGEGIIAKRRSYAVLNTHLTPPFTESELENNLALISNKIHEFEETEDEALREAYRSSLQELILDQQLHIDLGRPELAERAISDRELSELHDYLHHVARERITRGLYTLGVPYSSEEARETALLMSLEPAKYALERLADDGPRYLVRNPPTRRGHRHGSEAHIAEGEARARALQMLRWVEEGHREPQDFFTEAGSVLLAEARQSGHRRFLRRAPLPTDVEHAIESLVFALAEQAEVAEEIAGLHRQAQREAFLNDLDRAQRPELESLTAHRSSLDLVLGDELYVEEFSSAWRTPRRRDGIVQKWTARLATFRAELESGAVEDSLRAAEEAELPAPGATVAEAQRRLEHLEGWRDFRHRLDHGLARLSEGEALDRLDQNRQALAGWLERKSQERAKVGQLLLTLANALEGVAGYAAQLQSSPSLELAAISKTLDGGYVSPQSGGDPLTNPEAIPAGRNLHSINEIKTPTRESWSVAQDQVNSLIQKKIASTGDYPKKVAYSLWSSEFIRTQGIDIGQILYLMGVRPVWDFRGTVHDVELIPMEELGRPRIDVLVQTSGQFRDLAASRIYLIDRAVKLASTADDTVPDSGASSSHPNFVAEGVAAAERVLKDAGFSPIEARQFATARVFGGINGQYGTGIMGVVEDGDSWESEEEVADTYLNNMGAIYTEDNWSVFREGVFEGAIQGTDTVMHGRSANTWGPLSLDHVYEFMGGLTLAIRQVTGEEPDGYFSDLRNPYDPKVQGSKEAIWTESRSTLLNPKYISELAEGGMSSAEVFAETFRNTYGWNVMSPTTIDDELWDELFEVYVEDRYDLDLEAFFDRENPYAFQEMTAVMLETVRKELWDATPDQMRTLAQLHAESVLEFDPGCSVFVCDNLELQKMIAAQLEPRQAQNYEQAIRAVREGTAPEDGMVLAADDKSVDDVRQIIADNALLVGGLLGLALVLGMAVLLGGVRARRL